MALFDDGCWDTVHLVIQCALIFYIHATLELYTRKPLAWNGSPSMVMVGECPQLFSVLQKSFVLYVCALSLYFFWWAFSMIGAFSPPVCVAAFNPRSLSMRCCLGCILVASMAVSIWGFVAVMQADKIKAAECPEIYDCSWYSFAFYLIFAVIGFYYRSKAADATDESQALMIKTADP